MAGLEMLSESPYLDDLSSLAGPSRGGPLEFGGLQNQDWRGSGSNLRDPWDALMQSAFGDSIVARQMKALAALRAGDAQTAHEQTMPIAQDLASFVGNIKSVGGPIRAYHGSPHDFDKFSMDKIGAGEGAQAYGHGLYFAENEGVARSYRDALSDPLVGGRKLTMTGPVSVADDAALYAHMYGSRAAAIRELEAQTQHFRLPKNKDAPEIRALEYLRSGGDLPEVTPQGRMYEINIHADPERFLDWDKPLGEQPEVWRRIAQSWGGEGEAASRLGLDPRTATGRQYLDAVVPQKRGEAFAGVSRRLAEEGVPGVKYLDAGSRGAGDGSRNYVVFDDKLIEILRKYGIGGILAGGAGAASLGSLGDDDL